MTSLESFYDRFMAQQPMNAPITADLERVEAKAQFLFNDVGTEWYPHEWNGMRWTHNERLSYLLCFSWIFK